MFLTEQIQEEALQNAAQATADYISKHGEHPGNCGFAWVSCYEKGNTKMGKSFVAQGFDKSYEGGYKLWNPSGNYTQDMSAKMAGTDAYVNTVKQYLPEVKLFSRSQLD